MEKIKIGVIIGSTRQNRAGEPIAKWVMESLPKTEKAAYDLIDLKEENLPLLDEPIPPSQGIYEHDSTKLWSEKVKKYDGFIWITSEYNHGYPAPLKNAIDTVYQEWFKKPVAFVGYGNMGGVRAIEQLTQVAAEAKMVPLSNTFLTVRVLEPWAAFDDQGNMKPENVKGDFNMLSEDLLWWAKLLKPARASISV